MRDDDYLPYNDLDDDANDGPGIFYPLSIFFALGIWLVFQRYQSMRNRAVPFRVRATEVCPDPLMLCEMPSDACIKQIGPDFQAIRIEDPALDSHLRDPGLMPPVHLQGRQYITCFDPATSWHLGTYMADNSEDITTKITLSVTAQNAWKNSSFSDRRKVIRSLKKWLIDNQEACAKVAARDTGKTRE